VAAGLTAETAQLRDALNHGTAACYNQAGRACLVDKDSKFVIPMLVYWRQLLFAERTDLVDPDKLQSCLTFRFEFDTLLDHDDGHPPGAFTSAAHHRVDTRTHIIRWRPPFGRGKGEVATPNNYLEATWTAGPQPMNCVITGTGRVKPGVLRVTHMEFQGVNSFEEAPPLPKIDLIYNPGLLEMEIVQTCPPAAAVKYFLPLFTTAYLLPHVNEIFLGSLTPPTYPELEFEVLDWQVKLGALYALRAYQRTVHQGLVTVSEVTTLYVYHRPGN